MKNVRKPSLVFGIITTVVFFIGFFLMASESEYWHYILYAGLALGAIYWIWSIIEVTGADDLKKYQKRIKKDYQLSLDLYDSGVSDAMYLAGLIADE